MKNGDVIRARSPPIMSTHAKFALCLRAEILMGNTTSQNKYKYAASRDYKAHRWCVCAVSCNSRADRGTPAGYLNKTELGTVRLTPTRNDLCCCVLHPTVLQFSTCLNGKEHRRQVAPNAGGEREVDASSGEEHAELGWRKARYRRDDHQKEGSRPRAESPKC